MPGTLFTDVRILDCTGAEPYLGEVLVEAARIAVVVREPQQLPREGVDVIDGRGATLMPGLIESHAHLSIDDAADLVQIGMIPPEETTLIAVRNARLYLDCGITSCISAASAKPRTDIAIRNAINQGEIPGPRLLAASPWLTVTGGLGDMRSLHMPYMSSMAITLDGPGRLPPSSRRPSGGCRFDRRPRTTRPGDDRRRRARVRALADTSVFIAREAGRPMLEDRFPDQAGVSVVTLGELRAGVLVAMDVPTRDRRLATLALALEFEPIPIDTDVADAWARLRVLLRDAGQRMPGNDSWIAATAISLGVPVVTQDDDYSGVPELEVIRV